MNTRTNVVERREHPRVGVLAQLENITYSILRKHGVFGSLYRKTLVIQPIAQ